MSLNGLDDAKVTEAYQAALAEAGGWFLLKYASRDGVELLTRGTGGAGEARAAVAQYEESSPLYGFLLYRRRKVLIKYMPEGTSRLLQARVAVHFTAVTENFTPHDTIISITTAEELSDSALTSACSLHTAAPSSCSSSGSSRRHKLDEITEDAEEGQSAVDEAESASAPRSDTGTSAIPTIVEPDTAPSEEKPKREGKPAEAGASGSGPAKVETEAAAPESSTDPSSTTTDAAIETNLEEKPETKADDNRDSFRNYDDLFKGGPEPRMSSQTARPTYDEMYAEFYAQYTKPKVKLGPRPRPSLDSKRPHTSGPGAQGAARPVSSLPPGMRAANRKKEESKRPKSRESSTVPSIAFPPPPPIPAVPEIPSPASYAPKSPASVRSMPVPSSSSHHKSSGMTPEKQRLMKALELRKKQMKNKKAQPQAKAPETTPIDTTSGAEEFAKSVEPVSSGDTPVDSTTTVSTEAEVVAEESPATHANDEDSTKAEERSHSNDSNSPLTQGDSEIDMVGSHTEADDLNSAASASSPTSAQTQGSSCAPSTRPSSISEDDRGTPDASKPALPSTTSGTSVDTTKAVSQTEDEKDSIESSPTVVPESNTSVPSVEIQAHADQPAEPSPRASPSDDAQTRRSKRESMVFMPHNDQNDARSKRRSKRESMIFMPSGDSALQGDAQNRRQRRESAILSLTGSKKPSQVEGKDKRPAMLEPPHLSPENSEAEYLSDDSFMEELQSAQVQQAKPISVSKSPITAFFPRKSSVSEISIPERSASQQQQRPRLSPEQTGRKLSGPWPPQHANTDSVVTAKKINVSSGISQRIKALAEKSNRESSASVSPLATPDASNSMVSQRKSSFFSTPPSGNSPNGKPIQRLSRTSFATLSNSSTPDKKSLIQPPPTAMSSDQPVYPVQQAPSKPDSVQVTARIVRDARAQQPTLTMPDENTPLELHQSPITIDHRKANRPPSNSVHSQSPTKVEPTSPRPPSSSHSKEPSFGLPRSSSESSWRSFGRRLSESKTKEPPRSLSAHSFESSDEKKEEKKDKKDSKTSKLFKRMSSISSISRKNSGTGLALQEEALQSTSLPSLKEPPPAVQVGDLNIQFPDTLLWKRRWVEIDASGNLVLSPSRSNEKGIVKRFHLSELKTPYAPDQDRQELPNSVVLDFADGRTLQCACETHVGQAQVLQILREAHDAWLAYDQGQ